MKGSLGVRLRNYFLAGILVTAPVSITFWLAWKMITFVDDTVTPLIPPRWNPETYLPFGLPGLGLIVVLIFLTLVGFLAAGYVGKLITQASDRLVARVPIVSSVYSWTKQVFETVLSQKSSAFHEVVLVEYPRRNCWAVGFITGRTEGEVQSLTEQTVLNVFIPATPNPTTGFLLFVPEKDVRPLDVSIEEGIKLVISGGIVAPSKVGKEDDWRSMTVTADDQTRARAEEEAHGRAERGEPPLETAELAKSLRPGLFARLRNYFFAGMLVTAPIAITLWLSWEFVSFVDGKVNPLIPPRWNPQTYLPFSLPGLGLLLAIGGFIVIGFTTAGFLGRALINWSERIMDNLPVIRSIYSAVKQIFETVFKKQSNAFREVVLVEFPRTGAWAIGFITGKAAEEINRNIPETSYNIFLPTTPNPTSGFLLFIPIGETRKLKMSVEEGIKMVVSGGIVTPESRAEKQPDDAFDPAAA